MTTVYKKEGVVEAVLDGTTIIVNWANLFEGDIIKECTTAQLEQVKNGAKVIIVNTADARGVPPQEVQTWFGSTLFPALNSAGLKAIITVLAKSAVTRIASHTWKMTGNQFGFEMYETDDIAAALELAKKF